MGAGLDKLTRQALHAVAELLLAGPQYEASQTIKLRITSDGFATVALPDIRLSQFDLIAVDPATGESKTVTLPGRRLDDAAKAAGLTPRPLDDVYADATGFDLHEQLIMGEAGVKAILDAFVMGDAALRLISPEQTPVLWPEHFDVGISVGEVNLGISPGDSYLGVPYAYVGPWTARTGEFWNAPFGAVRVVKDLGSAEAIAEFFAAGLAEAT